MKVKKKENLLKAIKFDSRGLVPAIVVDAPTGDVLMMAYMNHRAVLETVRTRRAHFYSRSRHRLWKKGEESGHVQVVKGICLDCDGDVLLLRVRQAGPGACHTGFRTCFFRRLEKGRWTVKGRKAFNPAKVYKR